MTTPTTQREADERAIIDADKVKNLPHPDLRHHGEYRRGYSAALTDILALAQQAAPEAPVPPPGSVMFRGTNKVAFVPRPRPRLPQQAAPEAPAAATDQPSAGQGDERAYDLGEDRIDNALANFLAEHTRLNEDGIDRHAMTITLAINYAALKPVDESDIAEWYEQGYLTPTAPQAASQQAATPVATVHVTNGGYAMELSTYIAYALPEGMHELYAVPQAATTASASTITPWEDRESQYEAELFSKVERMEAEIADLRAALNPPTKDPK